ncbi:ABC transporter permease [Bacillus sp. Marseille-P3800]|uniref:ABC transporter permease n=1 Tax=Bacillus sp. Marseille-P3800 TaxID=2014782 RepID=UPI000C07DE5A|nr:ABC transporter permease [Bacillus sp. Marseille-P3800]
MTIINKLTIRNLRENKKRTLVTLFGTIVSVAMIFAVATIGTSLMDLLQRNAASNSGEWHVSYSDVSGPEVEELRSFDRTGDLILHNRLGFVEEQAFLEETGKPFLFINEFNEEGFSYFPLELESGRLPESEKELVLSSAVRGVLDEYELGETVVLEYGNRVLEDGSYLDEHQVVESVYDEETNEYIDAEEVFEVVGERTFTVVGFVEPPSWEPAWGPVHTAITFYDEKQLVSETVTDARIVADRVNRSLFDDVEPLNEMLGQDAVFNDNILRYHGLTPNDTLQTTLYSIVGIIMVIIVIGSISLIFNAFAISVSERSKQLGMLSSVGATKRQKRNSVYFEGLIIGFISIPIGLVAGFVGLAITFYFINDMFQTTMGISEELYVVIKPMAVLIAIAVSSLTIFFSSYIPARRASRISAIDAIRQSNDVKLTKKTIKTSRFTTWLFGMEAELALKNLKRNKKRYYITVFSLIISIVLFLSVTFFTSTMTQSITLTQQDPQYDLSVYSSEGTSDYEQLLNDEDVMDSVRDTQIARELQLIGQPRVEQIPERMNEQFQELEATAESFTFNVRAIGLDEASYTDMIENAKQTGEQRLPDHTPAIVVETIQYPDDEAGQYVETTAIDTEIGDTLSLEVYDWEKEEEVSIDSVEVVGLTDELPLNVGNLYLGDVVLIIEQKRLNQLLTETNEFEPDDGTLYLKSEHPNETEAAIDSIGNERLGIWNQYERVESDLQMVFVLSVFTYGFIALITLISVANIFNTISTGVGLRKKELAMYRSIGMTPRSFRKMIRFESLFYGINALAIGLPVSFGVMYLMYRTMLGSFYYPFTVPWVALGSVIIAVFIIVTLAMMYAVSKIKKESIIDGLKQENM